MAQNKKIKVFFFLIMLFTSSANYAQEIECTVEILTPKIQLTNKQIFETMKKAIFNFMNSTKFTNDKFKTEEKLHISMVFNIDNMVSQTEFSGSLQLVSSRPIYGSSYNSTMLRVIDNNIGFEFKEFEPLQYVDGSFTSNLTSILAFYAYMALGMDYDSFAEFGGTYYLNKALDAANAAQTSGYGGWAVTDKGRDNRYWLVFQMMDERFKPLRKTIYTYHRLGFDTFIDNMELGRAKVLESLEDLMKVHKNQPNSYVLQVFLEAKRLEIIDLFSKANQTEKNRLLKLVETIDVANLSKYQSGLNK